MTTQRNNRSLSLSILIALAGLFAAPAYADDTIHGAVRNTMPSSVDWGDTEDNTKIRAFHETGCILLPYALEVDLDPQLDAPDVIYNNNGSIPNSNDPGWWVGDSFPDQYPGHTYSTIPASTPVVCILLHMDSINGVYAEATGGVRLDNDVLGIITSTTLLEDSDGACAAPGVDYPAHRSAGGYPYRGMDGEDGVQFRHFPDHDEVNVRFKVTNPGDHVRILKSCATPSNHRSAEMEFIETEPDTDTELERKPETCDVEIVDGMEAAPGETIEIQWDEDTLYTSEAYISVHSGWGAKYYLSTVVPNTGSFDWTLPDDLDLDIDDYTVYVESAENGQRTMECWDYADLLVVPPTAEEPEREIEISPIPTPTPGPDASDLIGVVKKLAAQESCPIQGMLVGHFRGGEGMSNSFFRGKGFGQDGLAGAIKGQCTDAINGDGFCKGLYESVSGKTGRLRTQYATLGTNEKGAVGTFQGGWQADPRNANAREHKAEDELKNGHLAGVWQESAEHQKGMFLGFWSNCADE
jgi:hypothetical protein